MRVIPFEEHSQPRYFSAFSVGLLCLLVYVNTRLSFEEAGIAVQLLAFVVFGIGWFFIAGLSKSSAVFAYISLQPAVLFEGVGYFKLSAMALTPSDLFSLIVVLLFFQRMKNFRPNSFVFCLVFLLWVCFISVILADNPSWHIGSILRLGLLVFLIFLVISSPDEGVRKAVFFGFMATPFVVLTYLEARDFLWRFLSLDNLSALFTWETRTTLLGKNRVVEYLYFLFPLFLYLRIPRRAVIILFCWLLFLSAYSHSRALALGVVVAFFIYMIFFRSACGVKKNAFSAKLFLALFAGVFILAALKLGYFSFELERDGGVNRSNYIRWQKIESVFKTFQANPFLGIGYGAASVVDPKRISEMSPDDINASDYLDKSSDVLASAENTALQVLAETGAIGGGVTLCLLLYGFQSLRRFLSSRSMPDYAKFTLLALTVIFATKFLQGNDYSLIPFYMAIPIIFEKIRWPGPSSWRRFIYRSH